MLLKRTAALLLTLVFLSQEFSRYLIVADYYLHTEAYAQNCVNKDKPWMHCHGRCQLCKKLAQQERSEKQNPERKSGNDQSSPLSDKSSFVDLTTLSRFPGRALRYPELSQGKAIGRPKAYFHPPGPAMA